MITADHPCARANATMDRAYRMYINGIWTEGASGQTFSCVDPFNGQSWGQVPIASDEDVDAAVRAARTAFDHSGWPQTSPTHRATLLRNLAGLIDEHVEELATTQIYENGKLISEMLAGGRAIAPSCHYFAGLAESLRGISLVPNAPRMTAYTRREAIGVVAAITPWNTPLNLLGIKLFPALAAGCTIVIKPSEVTPVSTLRLVELCERAGFPPGVVNVITGDGSAGKQLVAHPGIDKISFTGSSATGKRISAVAAQRLVRVTMELGGKSPNIIFSDADLDNAVHGVMAGVFAATGQTCMAGSRVLVQESVYDEVVDGLARRAEALHLGDPLSHETQVGPVAFAKQFEKVLRYIELGMQEGAELITGGERPRDSALANGLFVAPTVFSGVNSRSRLIREEIFGPVACVIPFKDEDHAASIANDTNFGLVAGVWTENVGRAHRMIEKIRSGTVWVNTYRMSTYVLPYGGMKESGLGRESGPDALNAYTEEKTVYIDHGNRQSFGR